MKRKILKVLVAMLCVTITGCGSSADSAASYEAPASAADIPAGNDDIEEPAPEVADVYQEKAEDEVDFGRPPEDECVPWDEEGVEEEEVVPETGEVEGIIIVQADWRDQTILSYTVFAVNPDTGVSQKISQFNFTNVNQYNSDTIQPAWRFGRYANLYDHFSSDYTKMAATQTISSNGETHAGWIDTVGNFYDVTVVLGEQSQSDFDDPVAYHAVGFQDNMFIYVRSDDRQEDQYYGITVGDVIPGASWEIDITDKLVCADWQGSWNWMLGYKPTDWLDDDHALVETMQNKCRIAIVSTQTLDEYLPGESTHNNWSAVASPDGTKVAFISRPNTGEEINMYISSISGENPVRLEPDFIPIFYPQAADKVSSGMACCYILDWR